MNISYGTNSKLNEKYGRMSYNIDEKKKREALTIYKKIHTAIIYVLHILGL